MPDPRRELLVRKMVEEGTSDQDILDTLKTFDAMYARPVSAEDFTAQTPQPEGSALGRYLSNVGSALNPITAAQGIYGAVRHPIDTATNLIGAQVGQAKEAAQDVGQGRYVEAVGHGLAAALPVLGPAAAAAGSQIASGDIAGGLGAATGILAPVGVPAAVRGASSLVPETLKASIADTLAAKGAESLADVMTPKVGRNKARFASMAAKVAPAVAEDPELSAWSRAGLQDAVTNKLTAAEDALDAAAAARSNTAVPTRPVIDALLDKRRALTANGVLPAPNAARVAPIEQAIQDIKQLGPTATYDQLRLIRGAYDQPAKAIYNPSLTQDFLAKSGEAKGAADVTGVLRDHLAQMDPATAQANATYSLYRNAHDALQAVQEAERTRPKVGRQIIARMTGTVAGEQAGGLLGAAAGFFAGPMLESVASADWTTQIKAGQLYAKLAKAIRTGNSGTAIEASTALKWLVAGSAAGKATNPTGSQAPTGPALQPAWSR